MNTMEKMYLPRSFRSSVVCALASVGCVGSLSTGTSVQDRAELADNGLNGEMLSEQGGQSLSFATQGIQEDINEFSGGVRVRVPIYRLGSHTGYLSYVSTSEVSSIGALAAERNGLPFQWHRPWFARFTVANATRQYHGQMEFSAIPQTGFVEYADGTRERLYNPLSNVDPSMPQQQRRTSRFGEWQKVGDNGLLITANDGTKYTFGNGPCFGEATNTGGFCEVTEIEDRFGNGLKIQYYGQSDGDAENDSSTPRVLESYRRSPAGIVVTGRTYFYLGSHFTGSVSAPTSVPNDVFTLPSVWTGRHTHFLPTEEHPHPAWSNDISEYVRAVVYPGPASNALSLDASWHVTELRYATAEHGFLSDFGIGTVPPYFDWTNLTEVVTEGETYQFSYDYLSRWPKRYAYNPSAIGMMGSLHFVRLPRLSTQIEYTWTFASNSHENEITGRTLTSVGQDGVPAAPLVWRFRHQNVTLTEEGTNNLYRATFTNYPTGSGTLGLFYPLAADGSVAAARTGMLAERRVYDVPVVSSTWNQGEGQYELLNPLSQLHATRTEQHGYATYPMGSLVLEAPASESWADWSVSLNVAALFVPLLPTDPAYHANPLSGSYNDGHWQNHNFMGWLALPAFDVSIAHDEAIVGGDIPPTPCCMRGRHQGIPGNFIYCRTVATHEPVEVCREGEAIFQTPTACANASDAGEQCFSAYFGDEGYFCQTSPLSGDYGCPSDMTPVNQSTCNGLGACSDVMPEAGPGPQSVVRIYRDNRVANERLRPFIDFDQQFQYTTVRRDDYDLFGHRPFVREFAATGTPSVHRTPSGCTAQAWYATGPTLYGWQWSNADGSAGWSCRNDTVDATPIAGASMGHETRYRYLVEESPLYYHGESAFPMGTRAQIARVQTCKLGVPMSEDCAGDNLISDTINDYDYRTVAYPFADAPGSASTTPLGRLTYTRNVLLDNPQESPETFYRYYDDSDVEHEPNGAVAETAARVSQSEYRRTRQSYYNPSNAAVPYSTGARRTWTVDGNGVANLVVRTSYNTWRQATRHWDENNGSVRHCFDGFGRLIAEFDATVGDLDCPTGDEDVPHALIRIWYDRASNSQRVRTRTFFGQTSTQTNGAHFVDALGRTILAQSERQTDTGPTLVVTAQQYFADTQHPTQSTLPFAANGTLATFAGYQFAHPRTATQYDTFARPLSRRVYGDAADPISTTYFKYGDTAPSLPINVDETIDPEGRVSRVQRDALHRPTLSTLPDGSTISVAYNARGQTERIVHPDGRISTQSYDGLGRMVQSTTPESGTSSSRYNRVSEITDTIDANSVNLHISYDHRGRQVAQTQLSGTTTIPISSVQFDTYPSDSPIVGGQYTRGRATRIVFREGRSDFQYDQRGNITRYVTTLNGLAPKVLTQTFDSNGGAREQVYQAGQPDAMSVRSVVNANGAVARIERFDADVETLAQMQYDELGRLHARTVLPGFAGEQTENVSFDALGRVTAVNDPANLGSDVFAYRMGYETAQLGGSARRDGSPSEMEWNTQGLGRAAYSYSYDTRGRMTGADFRSFANNAWQNGSAYDVATQYNNVGAPTTMQRGNAQGTAVDTAFSYDAETRRLLSVAGGTSSSFAYDASGRLTDTSEWGSNNGSNHEVGYNAFGRTTHIANGLTRLDIGYNEAQRPVRLTQSRWTVPCPPNRDQPIGSPGPVGPGGLGGLTPPPSVGCYAPKSVRRIVRGPDGEPLAEYEGGTAARIYVPGVGTYAPANNGESILEGFYAEFYDPSGSRRALVHQSGALVQATDFDPYGAILETRRSSTTGATFESFATYRQRLDTETPFFLAGARIYHPGLGRFLSPDPLAAHDPTNGSYTYARSNPAAYNDPTGLEGGPFGASLPAGHESWSLAQWDEWANAVATPLVVHASRVVPASPALNMAAVVFVENAHTTEIAYHTWVTPMRAMVPNAPYASGGYVPGDIVGHLRRVGPGDAIAELGFFDDPITNAILLGAPAMASLSVRGGAAALGGSGLKGAAAGPELDLLMHNINGTAGRYVDNCANTTIAFLQRSIASKAGLEVSVSAAPGTMTSLEEIAAGLAEVGINSSGRFVPIGNGVTVEGMMHGTNHAVMYSTAGNGHFFAAVRTSGGIRLVDAQMGTLVNREFMLRGNVSIMTVR